MGLFDAVRNLLGGDEDAPADSDQEVPVEAGADSSSQQVEDSAESSTSTAADTDADLRSEFRPYAEEFAAEWSDLRLRFTENSLVRLDAFVDEQWGGDRFADAEFDGDDPRSREFTGLVIQTGSYLGMTLVHSLDAEWVDDEDFGAAVRVFGEDEDAVVNVFHIAANCLRASASFAETYERAIADAE